MHTTHCGLAERFVSETAETKHSREEPVVRVEEKGVVTYCMEVDIKGPSRMVYRPDKPRPCGAKLWIETDADVEMIGVRV